MTKAIEGDVVAPEHTIAHIGDIMDLDMESFVALLHDLPTVLVRAYAMVATAREQGLVELGKKGRDIVPSFSFATPPEGVKGGLTAVMPDGTEFDMSASTPRLSENGTNYQA